MSQQLNRRVLIVAAVAALSPLSSAMAGSNPEAGAFYTLDQDLGTAAADPRGAQGRIGADDPPGIAPDAAPALNPELGSFYSLGRDSAGAAETNRPGAAGPIATDESSRPEQRIWHAVNPEAGAFYDLSSVR